MRSAVSCPGFNQHALSSATLNLYFRGAMTMHEIPNLPFPSLHQPEQPQPPQSASQGPENEAEEASGADRDE